MDIPIRVYLPVYPPTTPVILASHGQGGSRMTRPYLSKLWCVRGYGQRFHSGHATYTDYLLP
jgi:hypothetical protein